MKNAIFIFVLALLTTSFNLNANNPGDHFFKTIILINGIPFFVEINHDGELIQNYFAVANYFESPESHDALVARVNDEYEEEMANLKNSRLIIFPEEMALLNDIAVDNIRDLARLYAKGYLQNINITAGHKDNFEDEALAAYRIDAIFQMLRDFGVEEGDISADMKIYKSDLPNQFVKIDLLK